MRIITGKLKGLRLLTPPDNNIRPTGDRVKESLFNIIGTRIIDAKILDLFGGSGNLSLESWSRGAGEVTIVDNNKSSLKLLSRNIEKASASNYIKVYHADAIKIIKDFCQRGCFFDIILCDPPYNQNYLEKICQQLEGNNILLSGGYVIFEHSKLELLNFPLHNLELIRVEKYGETMLSFLKNNRTQ